ncbi:MAG: hypothetical protein ABW252_21435 [Polyangiales bacterium]
MRIATQRPNQRRISHISDPKVDAQSSQRASTTTTGDEVFDRVSLSEAARAKTPREQVEEAEELEGSPFPDEEDKEFESYDAHGHRHRLTIHR